MDDFVISNLYESRNEWCSRLVNIFTPLVIEGFRSIFNEAWNLCVETNELSKYLMTFQNLLCRVSKWSSLIIEQERERIIEKSGCNYLEDLITCVHIIQLKVLTSIRVGDRQKKIDISIPKLDAFIHKVYINTARKIYTNVYLFEKNISPLEIQKNNRELEKIIGESILKVIQESIPTEEIVRSYLSESIEHEQEEIIETIVEEVVPPPLPPDSTLPEKEEDKEPEVVPSIKNIDNEPIVNKLTFNNVDTVLQEDDTVTTVVVPKTIEQLERSSLEKERVKKENENIKINYDDLEDVSLALDLEILDEPVFKKDSKENIVLDFEEL